MFAEQKDQQVGKGRSPGEQVPAPVMPPVQSLVAGAGNASRDSRVEAMANALASGHTHPRFFAVLTNQLKVKSLADMQLVLNACELLCEQGRPLPGSVLTNIAGIVSRQRSRPGRDKLDEDHAAIVLPPKIGALIAAHYPGGFETGLDNLKKRFNFDSLSAFSNQEAASTIPSDTMRRTLSYWFDAASRESDLLPSLAALLKHVVHRCDTGALIACEFIRDNAEKSSSWSERALGVDFLLPLRAAVAHELLQSEMSCQANLKLGILFPRYMPHPAIDKQPTRMLPAEEWILAESEFLEDMYGAVHARKLVSSDPRTLASSQFVPGGIFGDYPVKGVMPVRSRYELDQLVLQPVKRALGFLCDGQGAPDPVWPREFVSVDDQSRCVAAKLRGALIRLIRGYWAPEVSDKLRQPAVDVVRSLIRTHSKEMFDVLESSQTLPRDVRGVLERMIQDEVVAVFRSGPLEVKDRHRFRGLVGLMRASSNISFELHGMIYDEMARWLDVIQPEDLDSVENSIFAGAAWRFVYTDKKLEERAVAAIFLKPDSRGAGMLTRGLGIVRALHGPVRELAIRQSKRGDLEPLVWVNYAAAVCMLPVEEVHVEEIRRVFDEKYAEMLAPLVSVNRSVRAAFRSVRGFLHPDALGEIRSLEGGYDGLIRSEIELQLLEAVGSMRGLSVRQQQTMAYGPAIDGVLLMPSIFCPPIPLLVDGERYHSVNNSWATRGYDGISVSTTETLRRAGFPVIRLALGPAQKDARTELHMALIAAAHTVAGRTSPVSSSILVINPPYSETNLGGKVLLYMPHGPVRS